MTPLDVGQDIDRYTIEGVLGRGGMAVVYKVRHRDLDSLHALKVLTMTSQSVRKRLRLEGRAQAKLRHPNIVSVTDLVDVNGAPGLVMELVDGPSLEEWLHNGDIDLATADHIARGLLAGVVEAHRNGMVHRDLKPGNVLLATHGGVWVPKVTDFGLVKVVMADAPQDRNSTRAGSTMGTPAYMAPEQIRDAGDVDARADLFSLGVILYELVCGQAPFGGQDMLEMFNRICSGDYRHPTEHNPLLPTRMVDAIQASLVVERSARVPDCQALLDLWTGDTTASAHAASLPPEADTRSLTPAVQSMETYYQDEDGLVTPPTLAPEAVGGETIYDDEPAVLAGPEDGPRPDPPLSPSNPSFGSEPPVASKGLRLGRIIGMAAVAAAVLLGGLWAGFGGTPEARRASSLSGWSPVAPKKAEVPVPEAVPEPAAATTDKAPTPSSAPSSGPPGAAAQKAPPEAAAKPAPKDPAPKDAAPDPPPPAAEPVPAAPEARPTTGHVSVKGIDRVWLVNSAGRFPPGDVPPGTYTVKAFFDGTEAVPAGQLTVVAGTRHVLKCSATLTVCKAQ